MRLTGWVGSLANDTEPSAVARLAAEAAGLIEARKPLGSHHIASITCLVRNYYVHGGETASSRGFPAQEKVPVLRLLVGHTSIAALSMATAATAEMLQQLPRLARFTPSG